MTRHTATNPQTLDYVSVLYAGEQRFRSFHVGLIGITTALCAAAFALVGFGRLGTPSAPTLRYIFLAGSVLLAVFSLSMFYGIAIDRRVRFEITTAGIRNGSRRIVPWSRVVRFVAAGSPDDPSLRIFYCVGRQGLFVNEELLSTSPVSVAEYEAVVERLRIEVLPFYPQLKLGGYVPARSMTS